MTEKERMASRIPDFASYEEEASFWDTHDITELVDELTATGVPSAKRLSTAITIRLTPPMLARLKHFAETKGMGPSTLARMWLLERLMDESRSDEPDLAPRHP